MGRFFRGDKKMIDEQVLERMVNDGVAKCEAEYKAAHLVSALTREQQLEARLNEAEFRDRISEYALLLGVQPSALSCVMQSWFLRCGTVPSYHATGPRTHPTRYPR